MIYDEKNLNMISVVIPCLNEEKTLGSCIAEAKEGISKSGLSGEVIISDNGSKDDSRSIAIENGARVIETQLKGYGSAIINGINHAKGDYVIIGDADMTYDFTEIPKFVNELESGSDLIIGNRFKGGVEKGAMPFLNKYLGNPFLSMVARVFFKIQIGDFHCGLRGIKKNVYDNLNLKSTGMEFASEMIVKAAILNFKITEIPTVLRKPPFERTPHLKPFRDGFRHLYLIISHTLVKKNGLFFNLLVSLLGSIYTLMLIRSPININGIEFSNLTLLAVNLGFILLLIFSEFKKLVRYLLLNVEVERRFRNPLIFFIILSANTIGLFILILFWYQSDFGPLNELRNIKLYSIFFTLNMYFLIRFCMELVYSASRFFVND
jgi:glycosyltransferase involved in cell wall biosynthesis